MKDIVIHASKLLSGPLSLTRLEAIAHDLVFRQKITEEAGEPEDLRETLVTNLDKNALAAWQGLEDPQQFSILQDFFDAVNNALYDFKYSEYAGDDDDDDQHVTSFRSFK